MAECLADRLGHPCLAREILRRAADKLGVSEDVLEAKFEATPGLWARRQRDWVSLFVPYLDYTGKPEIAQVF